MTGKLAWKYSTDGNVRYRPNVSDGIVYFGSLDRCAYAVDAETGALIWKFPTGDGVGTDVYIHGDKAYFGSRDMNQYAIDRRTGALVWKFNPGDYPDYLAVYDGVAYVGFCNGKLYALDDETGKKLWELTTSGPVVARPIMHNNMLYFGSWDCNFYCVTAGRSDRGGGRLVWKSATSVSSQAPLEVPDKPQMTSFEVRVSAEDEPQAKAERHDNFSDYGEFTGTYIQKEKSDYVSGRKKGYIR